MEMKKTEKGIKKYTTSEKLAILREGQEKGVKATLSKYGLFPATYYYWKKKHLIYGEDGLAHQTMKDRETRIKNLEKENEQLKILLAEKELEGKLKDEILKKKYPELRRKI